MPVGTAMVTDDSGTLSGSEIDSLRELASGIAYGHNADVAVKILSTLNYGTLDGFARSYARDQGMGASNGERWLVVAVFISDREMRVQYGPGLSGSLSNSTCKYIINREFTPRFKDGDYYGGIRHGLTALDLAMVGEYRVSFWGRLDNFVTNVLFGDYAALTIVAIIVFYTLIGNLRHRYRRYEYANVEGYYDGAGYHRVESYRAPYGTTWDHDERSGCYGGDGYGGGYYGGGGFGGGGGGGGGGGASGSW